ncbi:hypothetical protein CLF_102238, partial [Clonorchis sinensis]
TSIELKQFLFDKGAASSHTAAYNPQCSGQVERLYGTLWKTICLALKSCGLPVTHWEVVLLNALHCIRSLLYTSINCTTHELFRSFTLRSANGVSLPTWLYVPGSILLKRNDRVSKYDPLVEKAELVSCNPQYAHIVRPDGKHETVSLRRLAPKGNDMISDTELEPIHIAEQGEPHPT